MKRNEAVLTIDKRRFHAIITELLAQHDSQMRNVLRELLKERSANLLGWCFAFFCQLTNINRE